jgi:hypothetical protein
VKKNISLIFLMVFFLSSCNLPSSQNTPASNQVDTQVALLLTTMPTNTIVPLPTQITTSTMTPGAPLQTETQTATATATNTATNSTTFTPVAGDPSQNLGTPTWVNSSDWSGFYFNNQDPEIQITQSNGNLVLTAVHANEWHGWSLTYIKGTNFYLEGTFKTGGCSGLDQYGLVFRAPDTTQGYFFSVSCDGEYSLRKWISSGFSDNDIISWTKSADISAGADQTNRLGVKAIGNQYSLYVNGKLLGEATDDSFLQKGIFGAHIASVNTPGFTVTVQSMRFWVLP